MPQVSQQSSSRRSCEPRVWDASDMAALTKCVDSGRRRPQWADADIKNIARCGPGRAPERMLTWRRPDGCRAGRVRRAAEHRRDGATGRRSFRIAVIRHTRHRNAR
ncbi:hypothetical protein F01_200188 [Burkholderia cenocepacia]|nr:hypothetical protein F01_200188 [Burkholderia cenocepacia]